MRILPLAFVLILSVSLTHADEPELDQLIAIGAKAVPARDTWERCTASVVRREINSDRTAASIAERALRRCKAQETSLRAVLRKSVGGRKAAGIVGQLRRVHQESLIAVTDELRRK